MGVFNALEFDGINSLDYGVYITGEAVFNSPQRAVEAVTVPGRNGDVLLDLGRYENIEVTYHAGVFGVDQDQFAKKIRAFRNMLASKVGYKRIVDTYNPTEYRLGTFVAPVDVAATSMNRHGEFDIVFNCKPQRFLMDGETAVTIADEQVLYNPTPFDAQPLLEVYGYGKIDINEQNITVNDVDLGDIRVRQGFSTGAASFAVSFTTTRLNDGDVITIPGLQCEFEFRLKSTVASTVSITGFSTSSPTNLKVNSATINGKRTASLSFTLDDVQLVYDESHTGNDTILTASVDLAYSASSISGSNTFTVTLKYGGTSTLQWSISPELMSIFDITRRASTEPDIMAYSTKSGLAQPVYIDCEIGEAYGYISDALTSLNNVVALPSDLPVLAPGENTFEYDNTVTALKVVPRWWIL